MRSIKFVLFLLVYGLLVVNISAQQATIREEKVTMKTYMFSDPDPVANIGRIYPYSRFDGFTNSASGMEWKMVVLENDYIKVFVTPEIGGKVWGAIEKSTGEEFLYYNSVVKFRDIAMRGPWTSGGLEFNFGDIGHIPTCATPVDYLTRENIDGSVSCFVGAIDLPSGTRWNIEINLPADRAYFRTKVSWFNTSSLPVTYYHWMNAAAKSAGNLEFVYPGKNHIGHGGEVGKWPFDGVRDISWYKNNNFGPYKSYHVLNSYSDFFGGYWHDDNFGFGHYATYDEKPGKKLWIWGLSKQGMIWEDLLTDDDGQYIEYQVGKLFNQAAGSSTLSPFKHREFSPYDSDIMDELWFPLVGTGGMVAASEYGALNVEYEGDSYKIILSALQDINDSLVVEVGDKSYNFSLELKPLQVFETRINGDENDIVTVALGDKRLKYSSSPGSILVDRPVYRSKKFNWESAYGLYTNGLEQEKQRNYTKAMDYYTRCLETDPGFLPALSRLALNNYRIMEYDRALAFCREALSIDTYDPEANFIYGLINRVMGNSNDEKSGFSISSHSPAWRSPALVELARSYILDSDYNKAIFYADKALEYNVNNISAYELLAFSYRMQNDIPNSEKTIEKILGLDALSDFAVFEKIKIGLVQEKELVMKITNEFPFESYLDLAIRYYHLNDPESAIQVLKLSPIHPVVDLWIHYLEGDGLSCLTRALGTPVEMVFPHRVETAKMLERLVKTDSSWKLKYYLGLIYWKMGTFDMAEKLFSDCGDEPDSPTFYLAKAELFSNNSEINLLSLQKAFALDSNNWRAVIRLSEKYMDAGTPEKGVTLCKSMLKIYPENPSLGICYARTLFGSGNYKQCLSFLESFRMLPYEGSIDGKKIYSRVCIMLSLDAFRAGKLKDAIKYAEKSKLWPENLGVGEPYDVDNRLEDFIIASSLERQGDNSGFTSLAKYKHPDYMDESSKLLFQALALQRTGGDGEAFIKMKVESAPNNIYLKWVYSRFTDSPDLQDIESAILSSDSEVGEYETSSIDKDFQLVLEVVKILDQTK